MTSLRELFANIGFREHADAIWELPVAPHVKNANGGIQGGLIATLVDIAAGSLAVEHQPPGTSVVTSDLSLRYLRPITEGTARAVARIVHSGRRSVVVHVDIFGIPANELAAIATVNFATVQASQRQG